MGYKFKVGDVIRLFDMMHNYYEVEDVWSDKYQLKFRHCGVWWRQIKDKAYVERVYKKSSLWEMRKVRRMSEWS